MTLNMFHFRKIMLECIAEDISSTCSSIKNLQLNVNYTLNFFCMKTSKKGRRPPPKKGGRDIALTVRRPYSDSEFRAGIWVVRPDLNIEDNLSY